MKLLVSVDFVLIVPLQSRLNDVRDLKAAEAGITQPSFRKSTERQILHGYIVHGVTGFCALAK